MSHITTINTINDLPAEVLHKTFLLKNKLTITIFHTTNCKSTLIRIKRFGVKDNWHALDVLDSKDATNERLRKKCIESYQYYMEIDPEIKGVLPSDFLSEPSREFLEANSITLIQKRSGRLRGELYLCKYCDIYLNKIVHVSFHFDTMHFAEIERETNRQELVKRLPPPTPAHLSALNVFLAQLLKRERKLVGLASQFMHKGRKLAILQGNHDEIEKTVHEMINSLGVENYETKEYGSTAYGLKNIENGFDLALFFNSCEPSKVMKQLENIANEKGYSAKTIYFFDFHTVEMTIQGVKVRVSYCTSIHANPMCKDAELFNEYITERPEILDLLWLIRTWARKTELDESNQNGVGIPKIGLDTMVIYFLQNAGMILHKSDEWDTKATREKGNAYKTDKDEIKETEELKQPWNLAKLFIDFFKFYVAYGRRTCIEIHGKYYTADSVLPSGDGVMRIEGSVGGNFIGKISHKHPWHAHFHNSMLTTYLSFAIPRTSSGHINELSFKEKMPYRKGMYRGLEKEEELQNKYVPQWLKSNHFTPTIINHHLEFFSKKMPYPQIVSKSRGLKFQDYKFEFSSDIFTWGAEIPIQCANVECNGKHLTSKCWKSVGKPNYSAINEFIQKHFDEERVTDEEFEEVMEKISELEKFIKENYNEKAYLSPYGSLFSGLGTKNSDVDICIRIEDTLDVEQSDSVKKLGDLLESCDFVREINVIAYAKVPIVKCVLQLKDRQVPADFSFYNVLALRNTLLLKEYSLWTPDNRFTMLALWVKKWAKGTNIGDSSKGTFSSYCHIISLISFLQQCNPPLLPRLQKEFIKENTDLQEVGGWPTYFEVASEEVKREWQKNTKTPAELFVAYLEYLNNFPYKNYVMQCRQAQPVYKIDKSWNRVIQIEDPFDHTHNLSKGAKDCYRVKVVYTKSLKIFTKPKLPNDLDSLLKMCSTGKKREAVKIKYRKRRSRFM